MPKPLFKRNQTESTNNILNASYNQEEKKQSSQTNKMKLNRLLRKNRSKEYMDALHKLDAGGHVHNKRLVDDIINKIREEFPEMEISSVLLGIVSICYLGKPYEVHSLDIAGRIIEHYKAGQPLQGGLEKARSIALRGGYEFIEVYVDCCRAVSSNGTVSVISY